MTKCWVLAQAQAVTVCLVITVQQRKTVVFVTRQTIGITQVIAIPQPVVVREGEVRVALIKPRSPIRVALIAAALLVEGRPFNSMVQGHMILMATRLTTHGGSVMVLRYKGSHLRILIHPQVLSPSR